MTQEEPDLVVADPQLTERGAVSPALGGILRDFDPFAKLRTQAAELSASLAPRANLARRFAEGAATVSALPQLERSLAAGSLVSRQDVMRRLVNSGSLATAVSSLQANVLAVIKPDLLAPGLPKSVLDTVIRSQAERTRAFADIAAKALAPSLARPLLSEQLRANLAQVQPVTLGLTGLADSAPWQTVLTQIGERNRALLTSGLLETFSKFATGIKDLLPDNLEALQIEEWAKVFAICEEDGVCLIWAPRTEHIEGLLTLPGRIERQQYLVEHRLDIVDDVLGSLDAVDHSELLDLVELARDAAESVRGGFDRPAQALLGNILDTAMARHGHTWLRATFPWAQFTSHRRKPGSNTVLTEARAALPEWGELQMLMVVPAMMVSGMMKAFAKTDREHAFNRHLTAHEASTTAYRTEFALSSLLIVQALLRQIDQHLHANSSGE